MNSIPDLKEVSTNILTETSTLAKTEILVGNEALSLLENTEFLREWDSLYVRCPWSTVFQSREFVSSWYKLYSNEHLAVISKSTVKGKLTGLLTLTLAKDDKLIMVAGVGGAEYQTWLALPAFGESFIKESLVRLQKMFPHHRIHFYNIPPETPLSWAILDKDWKKHCILKVLKRPLMDLRSQDVSKLFRKKQFREKLNRLKRLGEVQFEKVTDLETFASIIDELAEHSDFRKGAKYNHNDFRSDPNRKQYLLELYLQNILHVTVLKLNGEIIASIVATTGKKWLHLAGLNTHSAIYARYSPGLINFVMLGQLLMEEGMHMFDLTPGGDAYKERLATSHDQVHELYISNPTHTYIKKNILEPTAEKIKLVLNKSGYSPRLIKFRSIKIKNRVALAIKQHLTSLTSWHYICTGMPENFTVYKLTDTGSLQTEGAIKRNFVGDLLDYSQNSGLQSSWDFLEDAMRRFEAGEQVYTLSDNGRLLFCAWNSPDSPNNLANLSLSQDALILHGIYYHPRYTNRLKFFLKSVAMEILKENYEKADIYSIIDKRMRPVCSNLKKINTVKLSTTYTTR